MKSKIICLVLSLVFVTGAFCVNGTYAWFANYGQGIGEGVIHNFKSGSISYTLVGGFVKKEEGQSNLIIAPEQNLLKPLTALPDSLPEGTKLYIVADPLVEEGEEKTQEYVDTQLRMKVVYTYIDSAGEFIESSVVGQADSTLPFVAQLVTNSEDKAYWQYNEEDNYFYYKNPADGSDIIKGGFNAVDPIPMFSAMYYSGENSDLPTSAFKEDNIFTVKIVFEAKQAQFVTWKYLDTYELDFDFSKGKFVEPAEETPDTQE